MKNRFNNVGVLATIFIIVAICGISFLIVAGICALLCWALPAIGITAIGAWTVAFSWKLALVVWLAMFLLKSCLTTNK